MSKVVKSVEEIEGLKIEIVNPNPEKFITIKDGAYIYIPTAMQMNDTDLKLKVLDALVNERLKTKAELTDILGCSVSRYMELENKRILLSSKCRGLGKRIDFLECNNSQLKESLKSKEEDNEILCTKILDLQKKLALAEKDLEKKSIPWYKKIFK